MSFARFVFSVMILWIAGCATPASQNSTETEVTSPAEVTGATMDREKVRLAIREHLVPIRHCYEKELKTNPKLEGKLILEWDVEGLGKVTKVTVIKSVKPSVDECISEVIKGTLFPSLPKGQIGRIRYPFVFSSTPVKGA